MVNKIIKKPKFIYVENINGIPVTVTTTDRLVFLTAIDTNYNTRKILVDWSDIVTK